MKKLIAKTFLYILILVSIPYLYFVWQANKAVNTFLVTHPLNGEFDYQWLWLGLDGEIHLSDIRFYQKDYDPVFAAEQIIITPTSVFDLLGADEHILYHEYPAELSVEMINANTTKGNLFFALFNVDYQPEMANLFYPKQCIDSIDKAIPFFDFNLSSHFEIHQTADEILVAFDFTSKQFAKINGNFTINNFSDSNNTSNFVSGLSIQLSDLLWLQQNTQKCLAVSHLNRDDFSEELVQQLIQSIKPYHLLLSQQAAKNYLAFIYAPQEIQINFNLTEGKTFDQIDFLPLDQYQHHAGLSIKLNGSDMGQIFTDYQPLVELPVEITQNQTQQTLRAKPIDLKVSQRVLKNYLGTKILIVLSNRSRFEGYLQKANKYSLEISQLKYKGRSVLPFNYRDISSITLINPEK